MIVLRSTQTATSAQKQLIENADPLQSAETARALQAHRRNWSWLQDHWNDFLPAARGKYIVVADESGTVVQSLDEAKGLGGAASPA